MNLKENNKEALQQAIGGLKEQKAPEGLWSKIDAELNQADEQNKQNLDKAIDQLPSYELKQDLWENIDESLNEDKKVRTITLPILFKVAAAILILVASISILLKQSGSTFTYEISSEIVEDEHYDSETEWMYDPTIQREIDQLCSHLPENCNNPLVKELKDQLDEVSIQYNEIKTMLETDNTPELKNYLYRIENQKSEIEKELLNIIINS